MFYCCCLIFSSLVYLVPARDFSSLRFDGFLLVVGTHGAFQRDLAVLGNDLDVVPVGGKRFVFDQRLSYLLRDLTVRTIVFLLISRGRLFITVLSIHVGIVRTRGRRFSTLSL